MEQASSGLGPRELPTAQENSRLPRILTDFTTRCRALAGAIFVASSRRTWGPRLGREIGAAAQFGRLIPKQKQNTSSASGLPLLNLFAASTHS
jgi:hypothetical protein